MYSTYACDREIVTLNLRYFRKKNKMGADWELLQTKQDRKIFEKLKNCIFKY